MKTDIDVVDNIVQAVSILNITESYLESLDSQLSECDSLKSDFDHLIENTSVENINLKRLYSKMQENFNKRRQIKDDIALRENYKKLTSRLNNSTNREFLIQDMKNCKSKLGQKYHNRILTGEEIRLLKETTTKKGRGRPKKIKEGV